MSHHSTHSNRPRSAVVGALVISVLGGGCTQATHFSTSTQSPSLSAAGSFFSLVRNNARAFFETRTVSVALDRIDQHELPLDRTYRHQGTGRGVTVYVFDGGILGSHPELAGRVRKGFDGFPADSAVCNAHGTAVAGAIAGKTLGVAPEAEIVDVKMVECNRLRGTIKAITDGVTWTIRDHAMRGGPAIANWSFIADTLRSIPALDSAVQQLREAGIPVIVSAGNFEINACRVSPGNSPGSIVVGASAIGRLEQGEQVDYRAPNTAFGPCVDVYAPGDSVLLPSFDASRTPSVQLWNGTSMATGYVSGAIALYFEGNPAATPDDAMRYIRTNATVNAVENTHAPMSWLLYVGPRRQEFQSVAEVRAQLARKR